MADPIQLNIDHQGTLDQVLAQLGAAPVNLARAQAAAMRRLLTWIQRQALREASLASRVTQAKLKALLRYRVTRRETHIEVWIGTSPIKAHHLGTVQWQRSMTGARVGRQLFPGSWSWGPGSKTHGLIMRRVGGRRLPIEPVTVPIHEAVLARIAALQPEIGEKLMQYMLSAVRSQIWLESRPA